MAETKITGRQTNNIPNVNLIKNGNFINNSTNGYGSTPDDWTNSSGNPVQGGFPSFTKQQLIDLLGIADGDIEGLWNLNEASGNATDLSSNGYDLTDTNTVTSTEDGLMGKARDFESGNSECLKIAAASATNLTITGSTTIFGWIKPESLVTGQMYGHRTASGPIIGILDSTGVIRFLTTGLTTNTRINSDVALEAGKWYFICGVYDSTNTKLKIWINGVKKEVTASGTQTISSDGVIVGANNFGSPGSFFDGLIQNVGVLSVALTDSQVKKLWAYTTYKGQKIRRATSDGNLYQTLDEALVERLRGKTVTMRATMWQDTASIGQININDGSDNKSTTTATIGSWVTVSKTVTISATATAITLKLEANTSDGNVWFKEVALYEGSGVAPYSHSADDWNRFPRLLKLNPPAMNIGKPYQYEEKRLYTWVSVPTWTAGTAPSGSPTKNEIWSFSGQQVMVSILNYSYTAGATVTRAIIGLPIIASAYYQTLVGLINVGDTPNLTKAQVNAGTNAQLDCTSVSADRLYLGGVYQID